MERKIYGIIYKITNTINGMTYIGQTMQRGGFNTRYRNNIGRFTENKYLKNSINKHGIDKFDINKQLDIAYSREELNEKEIQWINFFNALKPNGYNLCLGGGQTSGYHYTEEQRNNISKGKKGLTMGEENSFFGKTHSDEQKAKWSMQRKNRELSSEWRQRIGESQHIKIINIETGEIFESVNSAATKYNIANTNLSRCCRSNTRTCRGYNWMYYDEYIKNSEEQVAL